MPSDETRRLLKIFGVAVTTYEDLVQNGAPIEQIKEAEAEVSKRLEEVKNHIDRLRSATQPSH
jgi:phage terminase Nu1 subunit (DNA packaging protein)